MNGIINVVLAGVLAFTTGNVTANVATAEAPTAHTVTVSGHAGLLPDGVVEEGE